MAIPALNPLWRTSPVDDREYLRQFAGFPATEVNQHRLTVALNLMADASPAAVTQVQAWIGEVIDLETTWADKLTDGSVATALADEYEGPAPGSSLSRDDLLRRADVVEWDTSALRVRIRSGGAGNSEGAAFAARIQELKTRCLVAIGLDTATAGARLIRS